MSSLIDRRTILRGLGASAMTVGLRQRLMAATPIDVFGIAGQSNSVGFPEAQDALDWSPIPIPGTAWQYNAATGLITPCVDPVYPTTTGSEWPQFCKTYHALTGRIVCTIGTGVGGSGMWRGQCETTSPINVNGCWDPQALLPHVTASIATINAGIAALIAAGYEPTWRGLFWVQGESDAGYAKVGQETEKQYIDAFDRMRPLYRTAFGGKMYVILLGTVSGDTGLKIPEYRIIRNAEEFCVGNDHDYAKMVFRGAKYFPQAQFPALQQSPNELHWTQRAYNRAGMVSAINVVNDQLGIGLIE